MLINCITTSSSSSATAVPLAAKLIGILGFAAQLCSQLACKIPENLTIAFYKPVSAGCGTPLYVKHPRNDIPSQKYMKAGKVLDAVHGPKMSRHSHLILN